MCSAVSLGHLAIFPHFSHCRDIGSIHLVYKDVAFEWMVLPELLTTDKLKYAAYLRILCRLIRVFFAIQGHPQPGGPS